MLTIRLDDLNYAGYTCFMPHSYIREKLERLETEALRPSCIRKVPKSQQNLRNIESSEVNSILNELNVTDVRLKNSRRIFIFTLFHSNIRS